MRFALFNRDAPDEEMKHVNDWLAWLDVVEKFNSLASARDDHMDRVAFYQGVERHLLQELAKEAAGNTQRTDGRDCALRGLH